MRALAAFRPETSAKAVGKSLATAESAVRALDDRLIFSAFLPLLQHSEGQELLKPLARLLRQDEIHESLAPGLRTLAESANEWLVATDEELPSTKRHELEGPSFSYNVPKAKALAALAEATQKLAAALENEHDDVEVSIAIRIQRRRP